MTSHDNARSQDRNDPAHTDLRERAARLRDAAGRFSKCAADRTVEHAQPVAEPAAPAPDLGTIPAPANAHPDGYGLRIDENGLGLHAAPGACVIVEPIMPTGAGLAVFYSSGQAHPRIWDLTHNFDPDVMQPLAPSSTARPMIEVVAPATGRAGFLDTLGVEKIHRVIGVYTPPEIAEKHRPAPTPLPLMTECPAGMGEHYVEDAAAYPLARKGETVVYDPAQREPTPGALRVLEWSNGSRSVMLTNFRTMGRQGEPVWWVDPVNRPSSWEMMERRRAQGSGLGVLYASDGPYDASYLREKIVGTVVGVRVPGRPKGTER